MDVSINGAKILATLENVPLLGTVHITQTLVVSGVIFVLIAALAVWLGSGLKVTGISRKQAVAEMVYTGLVDFVHGNVGTEFDRCMPRVGSMVGVSEKLSGPHLPDGAHQRDFRAVHPHLDGLPSLWQHPVGHRHQRPSVRRSRHRQLCAVRRAGQEHCGLLVGYVAARREVRVRL